jgi:predicted RNA-binding Zn ribbon-like protein
MTAQLEDRPAPGQLEILRLFVNTRDIDEEIELLASASAASEWFRSQDLLGPRQRLDERDHARVISLREALRAMLVAHANNVNDPVAVAGINAEITRVGLWPSFDSTTSAAIQNRATGVDGAIARLLSIGLQAAYEGTWSRLKACPADNCHWAFYDSSKNRSSRWCYMQLCGAKAKRETFRRRHPQPAAPARKNHQSR